MLENIGDEPDASVLSAYLARSYLAEPERAPELLVPFDFEDRDALQESLGRGKVVVPARGPRRELVDLAEANARHLLEEMRLATEGADERAGDPVYESCIWMENGRPRRAEYRKFKIATVEGVDDFASMREVVTRYFRRRIDESKELPDLVLIDGGKGQLNAAHEALMSLGLEDLPLVSLAKREEEVFLLGRSESLRLSRRSPALRLLQQARNEAHRFAITFQRKRRAMRTVTSELLRIPGIGPVKRRQLLQHFGSVQGVREASAAQIAELPGWTEKSAQKVIRGLAESNPTRTAGMEEKVPSAQEASTPEPHENE
jgi:excinuclease ABC subunit C